MNRSECRVVLEFQTFPVQENVHDGIKEVGGTVLPCQLRLSLLVDENLLFA